MVGRCRSARLCLRLMFPRDIRCLASFGKMLQRNIGNRVQGMHNSIAEPVLCMHKKYYQAVAVVTRDCT
jgi:hypothetical protein